MYSGWNGGGCGAGCKCRCFVGMVEVVVGAELSESATGIDVLE